MDFSDEGRLTELGCGRYRSLDPALLPPLFLVYRAGGPPAKNSGAVHSSVRQRWLAGDADVRCAGCRKPACHNSVPACCTLNRLPSVAQRRRRGMQQVAALAGAGRAALEARDWSRLAELMRENLRLRRQLYGDAVVGADSLEMAEAAASVGAAAKLTGSGGAVVALCPEGDTQAAALQQDCRQRGLECVAVQVGPQLHAIADDL